MRQGKPIQCVLESAQLINRWMGKIYMKKIGFIGYGLRSQTMMKAFGTVQAPFEVAAIADPRNKELEESLQGQQKFKNTVYYATAEQMLENERLDGVFLGTRCDLHSKYAKYVLAQNIPLFLEKPVCINEEQYAELLEASQNANDRVVVSFPLRLTCIVQEMRAMVASGRLGDITSVQAINNVPYGSVYYNSWYRDTRLTGGLFLQKATHDIDYITYILGKRPVQVMARTAKMYFKGERPMGLHCPMCPQYHTCPESSYVAKNIEARDVAGDCCCFAVDTGNEDVGAALFVCEDGTIINYHQTFLVKRTAGRRGARFIGTKATVEFDFYSGDIRVDEYHWEHTALHHFEYPSPMHFGGDIQLALAFAEVLAGKRSRCTLQSGLASAAACLAAKKAAELRVEMPINYGF